MAKIKVDVDYTIKDGSEVSFTAPCDCTAVTGLKVYHQGGTKAFTFVDSHGNDLSQLGNLFTSGAIVKVILDVSNAHAYIQNPDTNAYLENRINKAAPVNLLDNSDFRNPVNQRGQAKYMENYGYTIDRWLAYHDRGKLHVSTEYDGYLKVWAESSSDATFAQRFPKGVLSADKKYTFAYKRATGIVTIDTNPVHFGDSYDWVEFYLTANQTLNLVWAALYEGEYTKETLPEYHPKGYAHELAECKRYYQGNVRINIFQTADAYFAASYNHNMRVVPNMILEQVDIYGLNVFTDFTDAISDITETFVNYVKIPKMLTENYTNGSLLCHLDAEIM